ncbi:MAG: hypothetical protein ACFFCZ_30765 [Promethearchaeota archaeon]
MVLDVISLLMILANSLAAILNFGTSIFFIKRIREKKLQADILVFGISLIGGTYFLLNAVNYLLLSNITQIPLLSNLLMVITLIIPSFVIIMLGLLLKTAFRPTSENATALTYFITIVSAATIGILILSLDTTTIQWVNGPVLIYERLFFVGFMIVALLIPTIWFLYEMVNASNYLRKRLKEANRRSPDLLRLNFLLLSALILPLVLLFPMLPNTISFPVLLQRNLSIIVIPVFGLVWALGWVMPNFLRKRYS